MIVRSVRHGSPRVINKKKLGRKARSSASRNSTPLDDDFEASAIPVLVQSGSRTQRVLNARPDGLDFRDRMYTATLVEVPSKVDLAEYRRYSVPVLDQGQEGACTGFALASIANYLLRCRRVVPDTQPVSARMMYEMARRYDEWPGESYEGSSARGAMKGWHKHGVCAEDSWISCPTTAAKPNGNGKSKKKNGTSGGLTSDRAGDAVRRPLGAYYRINHKDLVSMHAAIAEVGILYATGMVHTGWDKVGADGTIPYEKTALGGHAFAIVAYDADGLWIQNSWGERWGNGGFGKVSYDDWLSNGTDVWAARLGAPIVVRDAETIAISHSASAGKSRAYSYSDLRPHIVSIGNDGALRPGGEYGTSKEEVQHIFENDIPRITKDWKKKKILLYAHGGLVDERSAVQRVADYRPAMLEAEVYPLSFIWKSDAWTTLTNILEDALRRRKPEGFLDATKDFMLDRLDDALEPLARALTGRAQWKEMIENATRSTTRDNGGARIALQALADLAKSDPSVEIHVVGHSAGSWFHGPLVQYLTGKGSSGLGLSIETCTMWAPACTVRAFDEYYLPAIRSKQIGKFALFTLTDKAEEDDHCANIYHKSLLYLVSNAFEAEPRIPLFRDGVPLLGMQKFVKKSKFLQQEIAAKRIDHVTSPNTLPEGDPSASRATSHGAFDNDAATVKATLARIVGKKEGASKFAFHRNASSLANRRHSLSFDGRS